MSPFECLSCNFILPDDADLVPCFLGDCFHFFISGICATYCTLSLVDRTDVKRIRKSADDGDDGLFKVVASVFGDKLDDVFVGAANGAMDYIAYVDETWTPEDDEDRKRTLETEAFHLESLKAVLEIAEKNGLSVVGQIRDILAEGEEHLRHLKER